MFSALCLLKVTPPTSFAATLGELCESDLSIEVVSTNATAPPSCHRSLLSPTAFCVSPAGFPSSVVLGLALSGLSSESFFGYLVSHPSSGFLGVGPWDLSPDDVSLLSGVGVSCRSSSVPSPSAAPLPPGAVVGVVVGSVGAAVGVACLVGALVVRKRSLSPPLLDSLPDSVYT